MRTLTVSLLAMLMVLLGGVSKMCDVRDRHGGCTPSAEISTGKVTLKGSTHAKGGAPQRNANAAGDAVEPQKPTEPPIPPGGVVDLPDTDRRSPFYIHRDTFSVIRPITASDVAEYLVSDAQARMQPDGWALVGEPARFFAHASTHTVSGVLLDRPAEVRFSPSRTAWDFGDTHTGRRAPAEPAGQHTYRSPGRYTATLTVSYRAEYRFEDETGWTEVMGTVPGHPVTIPVTVHNARARLIKNR